MQLWLIVPVKPFALGKSRLAPLLSAEERSTLARDLLTQTLKTVAAVKQLGGIIAISRDESALALARSCGASTLIEGAIPAQAAVDPEAGLNHALRQARHVAMERGADAVLVLPADLPLLTPHDVEQLIQLGADHNPCVVLAGSGDGGTNALLVRPPHVIDFAYGPQSLQRHKTRAKTAGVAVHLLNSTGLALDLDSPEDWAQWHRMVHS
jgi:2-phospho-L-lactate guanylyltransferase